jgi:DNA-binding NarL/FixJ family response regulator
MLSYNSTGYADAKARIEGLEILLAHVTADLKNARLSLSAELAAERAEKAGQSDDSIDALPSVLVKTLATRRISVLTTRQRQIMDLVLAGHPSKNIAVDIGISQRTVENHRAAIMRKTGATSLPALVRLALSARWGETEMQ